VAVSHDPVAAERRRHRERSFAVGVPDRPGERRVEVVDLGVEPCEMLRAFRGPERPFGSVAFGERKVVAVVALADGALVVRDRRQALVGVGADRFEHAQPGRRVPLMACTSRLFATS
jgi:hypothetical protein